LEALAVFADWDRLEGNMSGNLRHLTAVLLLVTVAGACGSGAATTAPVSASLAAPGTPAAPSSIVAGVTETPPTSGGPLATGLGGPIAKSGDLCGLLGPGDFAAAGIAGADTPVENYDDSGNYYCVYAGDAGATGGIEFDAFVGNPSNAYQSMTTSAGIQSADATSQLAGADKAGTVLNGPGGMAAIAVCAGQFCFDIEAPTTPGVRDQLLALARLVIQRGSGLTS
jgi:hypothetical protein